MGERSTDQEATRAQILFVQRLRRLVTARERLPLHDEQRRLLNYALYSTYRDCAALGIRAEAGAIIGLPRQLSRRQVRDAIVLDSPLGNLARLR